MPTKRVLIVDDEESIQAIVQFGIQLATNWVVMTASSGSEAVQTALVERPDAILLDMIMPDMDGIATFQALQSNPETNLIPVIFLTAQFPETRKLKDLAVRGTIAKPFNAIALPSQIAAMLNWSLQP
jgi:two-component system, OmpR family, alkaline phosphatase synthesis response regulator PhoP